MIRVLFIARYHDDSTHYKVLLLSQSKDLSLTYVYPSSWHDALQDVEKIAPHIPGVTHYPITLLGRVADPHRAIYKTLSLHLRAIRPDIIHAEEEPDSLTGLQIVLARSLFAPRAKLMLTTWQNVNRPKKPHVRLVMQTAFRGCDVMCCANQESIDVMRKNGFTGATVLLPPIGVDLRIFNSPGPRQPVDSLTIGYVGRLVPEKAVDLLIKAVHRLIQTGVARPVKLLIMGNGPVRADLQQLVHQLQMDNTVDFVPSAPPEHVADILRRLDVLVLPSRTTPVWKEQFGRVLVEAMACRVAVIGSDSGAIPEVIGDAGLIFKEGDDKMLTAQLETLARTPGLVQQLSERGYQRVLQNFTQEHIAAQTAALYHQVVR